jgi:hypothetical protein
LLTSKNKNTMQNKLKNSIMRQFLFLIFFLSITVSAQVGVGTTNPKGALDVDSTTMGLVIPRVPDYTAVKTPDGNDPENGTLVYDTTLKQLMFYVDDTWLTLGKNAAGDGVDVNVAGSGSSASEFQGTQTAKAIASDGEASDLFATTLSISSDGTTLVIGAYGEDDNGSSSGAVYVYNYNGSAWSETTKITPSDAAANHNFGIATSLSSDGTTLAIGARGGSAVYVYNYDGSAWNQTAKLTSSDGVSNYFGNALNISADGTTIAVGARLDDDIASNSGAVYVFDYNGSAWSEITKLTASDGGASDWFGDSVSLNSDGTTLAVGSYLDDDVASNAGAVYVYDYDGSAWSETTKLTASDGASSNAFGAALNLSNDGKTLAIGAYNNASKGAVYVFGYSINSWSQTAKITATDGASSDSFGFSANLNLDATTIAIGAPGDDGKGSAYVFNYSGGVWSQAHKVTAGDGAASDSFGRVRFSLDGKTLAVGASGDDDNGANSGSVYIFN